MQYAARQMVALPWTDLARRSAELVRNCSSLELLSAMFDVYVLKTSTLSVFIYANTEVLLSHKRTSINIRNTRRSSSTGIAVGTAPTLCMPPAHHAV